ncbi:flagellar basal body-associated protein FliL [Moritella sp. 24]|uniref:flagellar basal body-associated FliL family protein n=1 Tax=Moritella sp. 24 TaxID=2746230 RepID=UPI001BA5F69D|nr:flagellar basal body-associated FliL family protein [Moritella sp. 24]QUM74929.1 flagellar basal body-associated protein FliL [Moritella sp. 24]
MKKLLWLLCMITASLSSAAVSANDSNKPVYIYFGLEPDIITNYISETNKIGFISVSIEFMLADNKSLDVIEKHEPLIRDKIISLLGQQSPQHLRSLTGREEVRKMIQNEVNSLLKQESGEAVIENLLFTKYLLM